MKAGLKEFAELWMTFAIATLAGHYATAFPDFRVGILWLFAIALLGCVAFAGVQIALSLAQQSQGEESQVSVVLAVLTTTPAILLFLVILMGALTGVRTAWN